MAFKALENLSAMYDGYRRGFYIDSCSLVLLQHNGRPYLFENRCPHMDASLINGSVSEDGRIRCPVHGIEFELDSGAACGPLSGTLSALNTFAIVYEGNKIGIDL